MSLSHLWLFNLPSEQFLVTKCGTIVCQPLPYSKKRHILMIFRKTPIIASIYTSGRDEQNFSKANIFLPYRWDRSDPRRNALTNHVPSASLPFALGARSCIGQKIAMIQLTEVIHKIVTNFELQCINKTEVKAMTSQVLVPNQEIKLKVSQRNK